MEKLAYNLNELTSQQLEIVKTAQRYVRVNGITGHGKTHALIIRYATMIKLLGIPPDHILFITAEEEETVRVKSQLTDIMDSDYSLKNVMSIKELIDIILLEEVTWQNTLEDFDQLTPKDKASALIDFFNQHPDSKKEWKDRIAFLQVDDIEKLSDKEFEIIESLSGEFSNLLLSGCSSDLQRMYDHNIRPRYYKEIIYDFEPEKTIIMRQYEFKDQDNKLIPPDNFDLVNTVLQKQFDHDFRDLITSFYRFAEGDRAINIDDEVFHAYWGTGIVTKIDNEKKLYLVRFKFVVKGKNEILPTFYYQVLPIRMNYQGLIKKEYVNHV